MNKLEQLKSMTTVVADTGDINKLSLYKPDDATTNPSLILQAAKLAEYQSLVEDAIQYGKQQSLSGKQLLHAITTKLHVNFGHAILKLIPGYISTEVNPCWSFDTRKTIAHAKNIIEQYHHMGVDRDRVLIKIASTWEGIQAAKELEESGIQCNMTLIFNFHQAIACAQSGVTLISPFVGRILDWYKANTNTTYDALNDPGVLSVKQIYQYYKHYNHKTIVMGASFRNTGEIEQLAGCDRLTISPTLMTELQQDQQPLLRQLSADMQCPTPQLPTINEQLFRWELNQDAMATEKLAEGIRKFAQDTAALNDYILQQL